MKRTKTSRQQAIALQEQPQRSQSLLVVPSTPEAGHNFNAYENPVHESADPDQETMLHPPVWLFILGGIEIVWGGISNIFQAVTSFAGIMGWQQQGLVDAYGYTRAAQIAFSRNLGLVLVALVLSMGAQIGIQAFTQQISRTWKKKRVIEHESTQQAMIEVITGMSIGQLLGYISILICAWSDYMFVTQIDSTGSLGSYILMSFWAIILGCSSTYVLMDGIQRVWSGMLSLRAWRLWQDTLKAHFQELARQYQQ